MDKVKNNMYPYKIRITDPELIDAFKKISEYRAIQNKNITKRIGHKIPKNIKRDGFCVKDGIVAITNSKLFITYKPAYGKRKGYDFEFKTKF